MKLTENFTLEEMLTSQVASNKGIENKPFQLHIDNMLSLCEKLLQPLRDRTGPIFISSGYRSLELNRIIGGSLKSQHCIGEAVDIQCSDKAGLFNLIQNEYVYDQLIWEFGDDVQPDWIHVSYKKNGNRRQSLKALKIGGSIVYKPL